MARSRLTRVLLLAMLLVPLILMVIRPASGEELSPADDVHELHDGHAVIQVEGRHPGAGGTIHYVVRVTWSGDGHPAVGSAVTAARLDAFGNQLSTVTLDPLDADGRYGGAVTLPSGGPWTVRFTSSRPAGSLDSVEQLPLSVPVDVPELSLVELPRAGTTPTG